MGILSRDRKTRPRHLQAVEAIQPTRPADDPERIAKEEEARYEAYRDERKALVESEHASADGFDKHILTLASGALAVSLVFLEKIAPEPKQATLPYLYLAWGTLVLALCFILSSFLTSQHAHRKQRQLPEETFYSEPGKD